MNSYYRVRRLFIDHGSSQRSERESMGNGDGFSKDAEPGFPIVIYLWFLYRAMRRSVKDILATLS
jgi:hypothetical protein